MLQERVMLALENAGLFKAGCLMKEKVLLKFMACTLKIYLMGTYKSSLSFFGCPKLRVHVQFSISKILMVLQQCST